MLTLGAPGLDFTLAGSSCTGTVASGTSCSVQVFFAPQFAGLRTGAVEITGESGNVLSTTLLEGKGLGPQAVIDTGEPPIGLLSGALNLGDAVAIDGAGNVFLANAGTAPAAVMELPADGGPLIPVGAGFTHPSGLAIDGAGNVYVTDAGSSRVVIVPPGCVATSCERYLFSGFDDPIGIAVDGGGNVYVADTYNFRVVELPAGCSTATRSRVLGSGFASPNALTVDADGNLLLIASGNLEVVKFAAGSGAQSTVMTGLPFLVEGARPLIGDEMDQDGSAVTRCGAPAAGRAARHGWQASTRRAARPGSIRPEQLQIPKDPMF